MELMSLTAVALAKKIASKEVMVEEAVKEAQKRIKKRGNRQNSYITILDEEVVMKRANEVQKAIDSGKLKGSLAGVPITIKDNICTKDILTTCASKMLSNFKPTYSADVVESLEKAGAIIIGKTNMDEFAMGSTSETSYFGVVKNPWNEKHVSGGSSGGSCVAVAMEECSFAIGSDTGGSIRLPSSYCGVIGMKPTYGTVSRYGLIAYASSLEQIGPIARDVTDCATIMEIISNHSKNDSTSIDRGDVDFTSALINDINGMKIGIPREYFMDGMDEEVREAVLESVRVLEDRGASVEEFSLGFVDYAIPAYYTIACAEASSNLGRFDGVKYGYRAEEYNDLEDMYRKTYTEGFGSEVKRRIELGSFVLSSGYYEQYYRKALEIKALIKEAFDKAFQKYDIIVSPTSSTTAPKIGDYRIAPIKMYLSDIYTISSNLVGIPAISIPCGMDKNGLPIGLQFMGDCFRENEVIRVAYTFEQTREYQKCEVVSERLDK